MPNENSPVNAFKKGHKKVGGRPPGRRNILTNDLKEAPIEESAPMPIENNVSPTKASFSAGKK